MSRDGKAPPRSERLYLRMPPERIALFKFLLEGHDSLALLTVVDRCASVVRLLYPPERRSEVDAFLDAVGDDIPGVSVRLDTRRA